MIKFVAIFYVEKVSAKGKHEEARFNLSMSFAFYFGKPLHPGKETSEIVPLALGLSNRVHTLAIRLTKIVT